MITFTHPNVISYLLANQYVYTIRKTNRPTGRQLIILERHGRRMGAVTRIIAATNNSMSEFYKESGFDSWEAWRDAAEGLHNTPIGASDTFAIFKVDLIP